MLTGQRKAYFMNHPRRRRARRPSHALFVGRQCVGVFTSHENAAEFARECLAWNVGPRIVPVGAGHIARAIAGYRGAVKVPPIAFQL